MIKSVARDWILCPQAYPYFRALHLADLITELNGRWLTLNLLLSKTFVDDCAGRLLRSYVCVLQYEILSGSARSLWQPLGGSGIHALWIVFRLHGREGGEMAQQILPHGPGT